MQRLLLAAFALAALAGCDGLWAQGTGTTRTIYSFQPPPGAAYPEGGVIIGSDGALYGTSVVGGPPGCGYFGCGTVFSLAPPASRGGSDRNNIAQLYWSQRWRGAVNSFDLRWQRNALRLVKGRSGWRGFGIRADAAGIPGWGLDVRHGLCLPGTAQRRRDARRSLGARQERFALRYNRDGRHVQSGYGIRLTPPVSPGAPLTLAVLYSFRGDGDGIYPGTGVVIGREGVIYGTTTQGGALGDGTVFALKFSGGVWKEKVLSSLGARAAYSIRLVWPSARAAYSTPQPLMARRSTSCPPLWRAAPGRCRHCPEAHPLSPQSLAIGPAGELYWTTPTGGNSTACGLSQGCGTLYELMPPASPGLNWTPVVLHNFTGQHGDGYQPNGELIVTQKGAVYGTTTYGGRNYFGTVFKYTP
jgi:hypothetical protein